MAIRTLELRVSTAISGAQYDTETKTLSVTFVNGSTYDLHEVPEEVVADFESAPSPGKFWWSDLKDRY